jgi:hypothetical protein
MSISDCRICLDLIEHAQLTIRRHLTATTELAIALQKNESPDAISALEESVRVCSLDRENAVATYEAHLSEHRAKAMAADSDPAC